MAAVTLKAPHPFAVGATVTVYAASDWPVTQRPPSGSPPGSAVTTAVVGTDKSLAFTGLADGTDYYAYQGGNYVGFSTPAAAATQTATLSGALPAGTNAVGKVGHDTTGIGTLRQAVTTAGTRVQLSSQACKWALVQCAPANTSGIAVGDANVVAASGTVRGIYLAPGDPAVMIPVTNLNQLYIDSRVNGEAATITYGT